MTEVVDLRKEFSKYKKAELVDRLVETENQLHQLTGLYDDCCRREAELLGQQNSYGWLVRLAMKVEEFFRK